MPEPEKKASALSGSWHGVPTPLLAVGGGVGVLLIYRWYKNRASTSTSSAATPTSAATGTDTGTGLGYSGTGSGSGGGGGDNSGSLLPQILAAIQSIGSGSNTATPATASPPTSGGDAVITTQPLQPVPVPGDTVGPTPGGGGTTSIGRPAGPPSTGPLSPSPPVTNPLAAPNISTFGLPGGTISFDPTAIVQKPGGGQTAYGIGTPSVATAIRNAGGKVYSGQELNKRGFTNLTPGAQYLLR